MTEVQRIIDLLKKVTSVPEDELDEKTKEDRRIIFINANDALKNLLLGKFGKLPLGWPPAWVYQSVFGDKYEEAIADRTEESPLNSLPAVDIDESKKELATHIGREPNENELVNYLNHPGDALKLIKNLEKFSDPNVLPDDIWFEGLETGVEREFRTSDGKVHTIEIMRIGNISKNGTIRTRYKLEHEVFVQEILKRVLVFADYKADKKMIPVKKGQLLIELAVPRERCRKCNAQINKEDKFCPNCGSKL
jgi:pyruvate carboxylase